LTPEAIETILADFRAWLTALLGQRPPDVPLEPGPAVDLHTLLSGFVALRHEVNLQTRATRAQQEQNTATLEELAAALAALRQTQSNSQSSGEEVQRPLLKTLVDLYDALALAEREVRRSREGLLPSLEMLTQPTMPRSSWWAPWFGRARETKTKTLEAAQRTRQFLDSLLTGYTMSLQRLDRALRQHGLEPIPAAGLPFDPEQMEVLEVVADSGRPSGEVVEEVRRGYLWKDRVFRYAQVRVAKP
jgi:molecular chaperone GrpE